MLHVFRSRGTAIQNMPGSDSCNHERPNGSAMLPLFFRRRKSISAVLLSSPCHRAAYRHENSDERTESYSLRLEESYG